MLTLSHISAGYGKKKVLENISTTFKKNAITVVMGPNGAGKSTLLKVAYGLLKPYEGQVLFEDKPVKATPQMFVQKGVFMIPQGSRVFKNMTVQENIELATHFWKSRKDFATELERVLSSFEELKPFLKLPAGNLSGGQQQMVALARGLINKPTMVLMDEPSIGLSPKLINDTFYKLKEIKDKTQTAFVIVEHNLKTLLPLTDFAYILKEGKVAYSGKSQGDVLQKMMNAVFE